MAVLTDIPGLLKFGWTVIKKRKSLVEENEVIQNTLREDQAVRAVFEAALTKLKGAVSASDEHVVKLAEANRVLEAADAEVALLNEEAVRENSKNKKASKRDDEGREEVQQRWCT